MSVEEKRFACDIFDMFAMYSSLVVLLMQTCLAQNAGAHGPVSVTFKSQFLTIRIRIEVNNCWAYSLYYIPIDRAGDASLVRDPLFNSLVRFPFI